MRVNGYNRNLKIGIVGCGHLGLALAKAFVSHGLDRANLKVSHSGHPATLEAIKKAGLGACVSPNAELFPQSDIVFITLRPDAVNSLRGLEVNPRGLQVSCVAGVECVTLKNILGTETIRLMPSGPDSIETGSGIAALYPGNGVIAGLLNDLDVETLILESESGFHAFTALVCLPAAYLQMDAMGTPRQTIDASLFNGSLSGIARRVEQWARKNTPDNLSPDRIAGYIYRMATKGGITEAVVGSIGNGSDINTALLRGIGRGEVIAARSSLGMQ